MSQSQPETPNSSIRDYITCIVYASPRTPYNLAMERAIGELSEFLASEGSTLSADKYELKSSTMQLECGVKLMYRPDRPASHSTDAVLWKFLFSKRR